MRLGVSGLQNFDSAADSEVYDVVTVWPPNSTDIFVSTSGNGSLRAFDLWTHERSTRLYETPPPKNEPPTGPPSADRVQPERPELHEHVPPGRRRRQILDMCSPGVPSMRRLELDGKRVGRDGRCQCVVRNFRFV
jgi:hypothetical protein